MYFYYSKNQYKKFWILCCFGLKCLPLARDVPRFMPLLFIGAEGYKKDLNVLYIPLVLRPSPLPKGDPIYNIVVLRMTKIKQKNGYLPNSHFFYKVLPHINNITDFFKKSKFFNTFLKMSITCQKVQGLIGIY